MHHRIQGFGVVVLQEHSAYISPWRATRVPDQCIGWVGYDIPPLQVSIIYIPYKDAVTCRNRAWTEPLPACSGTIPTRCSIFIGDNISCRTKKCHIGWWSNQVYCILIFGSRLQPTCIKQNKKYKHGWRLPCLNLCPYSTATTKPTNRKELIIEPVS